MQINIDNRIATYMHLAMGTMTLRFEGSKEVDNLNMGLAMRVPYEIPLMSKKL